MNHSAATSFSRPQHDYFNEQLPGFFPQTRPKEKIPLDSLKEKQARVIRCVSAILDMPPEQVAPFLTLPCMELYPNSVLQGKFELTEKALVALSYLARSLKGTTLDFRFCAEEVPLELWEFKCYYFSSIPTLEHIILGHEENSRFKIEPFQKALTATESKVRLTAEVIVNPFKKLFAEQEALVFKPWSTRPLPKAPAAAAIHQPEQEEAREAR